MNLSVMNLLPFNRPKLKLESCRGQVRMVGEDQIQLGEKNYKVSKYVLEVASKIEPLKLSFFLNKNLVIAIADSRIPSERLQLVEYKKFSDF